MRETGICVQTSRKARAIPPEVGGGSLLRNMMTVPDQVRNPKPHNPPTCPLEQLRTARKLAKPSTVSRNAKKHPNMSSRTAEHWHVSSPEASATSAVGKPLEVSCERSPKVLNLPGRVLNAPGNRGLTQVAAKLAFDPLKTHFFSFFFQVFWDLLTALCRVSCVVFAYLLFSQKGL